MSEYFLWDIFMLNLYSVVLGGRAEKCNTELHDVVFVVGLSLEDTYPQLVNKWFGMQKQLHIDASIKLQYVDGYEVTVSTQKPANDNKALYFVNFGAYKEGYFGEMHEASFYVASSKIEASSKAKKELCIALQQPHCDDNQSIENLIGKQKILADDVLAIDRVDQYYIQLKQTNQPSHLDIKCEYLKLDLPEILERANFIK